MTKFTRRGFLGTGIALPFIGRDPAIKKNISTRVALLSDEPMANWDRNEEGGYRKDKEIDSLEYKNYSMLRQAITAKKQEIYSSRKQINGFDIDLLALGSVSNAWVICQQQQRNRKRQKHRYFFDELLDIIDKARERTGFSVIFNRVSKFFSLPEETSEEELLRKLEHGDYNR